jgi:thiol-disulfide isomerase/thioredoxin
MKRSASFFVLCFSFCAICVHAQQLKLKKGQKLSYELLKIDDYGTNKYVYFDEYEFVVTAVNKDGYVISASKPRSIAYDDRKIVDSRLPLEEQPKNYDAVANKVISGANYQLTIDKAGKVLKTDGIAAIKEKVLAAIKEVNATSPHMNLESFAMGRLNDRAFSRPIEQLLTQKPVIAVDTVKTGMSRYATSGTRNGVPYKDSVFTIDTMHVKRQMGHEAKTGLLISSLRDSLSRSVNIKTGETRFERDISKINLKSSTVKALGFGPLLFDELKKLSDYDTYFSPAGKAASKVNELYEIFHKTKGKVGVKDSMLNILAELDKQMKEDDYPYMTAKASLIGSLGMDYNPLIGKIPYEYFKREFYVMVKLEGELKENNTQNLSKAINILFTKFSVGRTYPLNMHVLESAFHVEWAKHVFNSNDKATLLPILNSINEVEKLGFPRLNAMLGGLKIYLQVKLTDDKNTLNALTASNTSAPYDKYGRYRLLIFDELSRKGVADSLRLAYIDLSIDKLKKSVADSSDFAKSLRPFFRKYLADAYYRKSRLDQKNGLAYLQMASDYLPSQQDKLQNAGEVTPEYEFLPAVPYGELYMAKAETGSASKDVVLEKYAELVIIEPERYGLLKEKYQKAYPTGDFKVWFAKVLKAKLPATPSFALKETSGKQVGNAENKTKFIFIDFWGTWCGACINEIHKIEELHVNNDKPEKLMVTTIASYDKKEYVDAFMAKRKYTYQVLMSDNLVENKFNVSHYPTKLLLLPNGTYLIIPYTDNYKTLVDKYLKWDI